MIFRKKNFFWKYIDLDFRDYVFNHKFKVMKNTSIMYPFFYDFKYKNNYCKMKAKYLFYNLVMSGRMESILSTRLNRIINCGEFDSL